MGDATAESASDDPVELEHMMGFNGDCKALLIEGAVRRHSIGVGRRALPCPGEWQRGNDHANTSEKLPATNGLEEGVLLCLVRKAAMRSSLDC